MFGYRSDGKKIKDLPPIFKIMPCVMPERVDSQVYFKQDIPIKKMDECININTCLSANILNKLGIVTDNPQNYQILIDYLVNYCFDVLLTKKEIDIQKEKIGQLFVHMLEKYLEK